MPSGISSIHSRIFRAGTNSWSRETGHRYRGSVQTNKVHASAVVVEPGVHAGFKLHRGAQAVQAQVRPPAIVKPRDPNAPGSPVRRRPCKALNLDQAGRQQEQMIEARSWVQDLQAPEPPTTGVRQYPGQILIHSLGDSRHRRAMKDTQSEPLRHARMVMLRLRRSLRGFTR